MNQPTNLFFNEDVIAEMRETITLYSRAEVFFFGITNKESDKVESVYAASFGTRRSVAMLHDNCFSDCMIHNHPSGNLIPSESDIEIAALIGKNSFIINNEATLVRVICKHRKNNFDYFW